MRRKGSWWDWRTATRKTIPERLSHSMTLKKYLVLCPRVTLEVQNCVLSGSVVVMLVSEVLWKIVVGLLSALLATLMILKRNPGTKSPSC